MKISLESLSKSAAEDCDVCSILSKGLSYFHDRLEDGDYLEFVIDSSLFVYVQDKKGKTLIMIEFYTLDEGLEYFSNDIRLKIGPARAISRDSSNNECIKLARHWLDGCLNKHELCNRESTPHLPSRVIDVGSQEKKPHLYISHGEQAEYAALSHSWGGKVPLETTISTIEDRKEALHFNDLSKTFRDAVEVTRQLGIPYLWIDSLCILQDSREDWDSEAAKMCDVYNNATVTISADSALNTSEGLFPASKRRALGNTVYEIPGLTAHGQPTIYIRERSGDPFHIQSNVHSNTPPEESKLVSRGWVLQEELLSPRMLHFNTEELSWVCSTYSRCECRLRPAQPIPSTFRVAIESVPKSPEMTSMLFRSWTNIVEMFTRRELTRITDRLPALSGIAARVERHAGDEYFCGLWFHDLSFQLLWYSDKTSPSEPITRLASSYAPSWSWASISGPISYYSRTPGNGISANAYGSKPGSKLPLLVPLGCWTVGTSTNKYGAVDVGFIRFFARILPMVFLPDTETWLPLIPVSDFKHENLKINLDVPSELPTTWTEENAMDYALILVGTWQPMSMSIVQMQTLCLLVRRMDLDNEEDLKTLRSAVSHPAIEIGEESFVRVGIVRGCGSEKAWEESVPLAVGNLL